MSSSITKKLSTLALTDSDVQLIQMWLHGKSPCSQRSYATDIKQFLDFVQKPLVNVSVADIIAWDNQMSDRNYSTATRARRLSAVKSLLSYACKIGVLTVNVGMTISTPAVKDTIAERILSEMEWFKIITNEPNPNRQLMLQMLYETRARVEEFCNLKWRDIREKGDNTAVVTLFGKGGKTRNVTITPELWQALQLSKGDALSNAFVFRSRQGGGRYSTVQVWRIVKEAGERVGISGISPHWLRHTGATHQLMNGSPVHIQQRELGHAGLDITSKYLHLIPGEYGAKYVRIRLPSN